MSATHQGYNFAKKDKNILTPLTSLLGLYTKKITQKDVSIMPEKHTL